MARPASKGKKLIATFQRVRHHNRELERQFACWRMDEIGSPWTDDERRELYEVSKVHNQHTKQVEAIFARKIGLAVLEDIKNGVWK